MALKLLRTHLLFITLVLLLPACSNTKHLPKDELLFRGSKVHINDAIKKSDRKALSDDLATLVRPKPNSKFLGIRLKLSLYNMAGKPKKNKGLRNWLRNKAGEPPVLMSSVNLKSNEELMANFLNNRGFFGAKVTSSVDTAKNRKATARFEVFAGPQYSINKVMLQHDSTEINKDIDSTWNQTLLKPGAHYNLDIIKAERVRIDRALKQMGYFYFLPDYVLVVADSSIGDHKVNLYVKLKHREIPEEAYKVYVINDIFVYTNFRLRGKEQDTAKANKVAIDGYYVIDNKKAFKPSIFSDAMVFEKGDDYNLDDQNTSLSRLVNMGVFKFVKNRFEPVGDTLMDVYYYLTPFPKKSLRFEVGVLSQNDNRAGTQGSISWRNRNTFKGAEELMFKINGGFEAQVTGIAKLPNIYTLGAETDLTVPRFMVPFVNLRTNERTLPRTIMKLKYNYETETGILRINSYTAGYGYDFKDGLRKEHQLYPFNFTYVKTDTLGNSERLKLLYGNLVFNGIIIGPTYELTYNSQASGVPRKNAIYFDGLIDLSGNILGIAEKADYKTNPKLLFGSTFAQYIKLQPDFRHYYRISQSSVIATRVVAGLGIPYGNSSELPNVKQFWAGGNSDLRGFPSRLVGPGTFSENTESNNFGYVETLGDMKLELNTELRQNVYKFVNLGFFFDAGNIWLYRDNPAYPGGKFSPSFYKELAADVGVGLRLDFKILILRLDLGMPVRDPSLSENNRWVFNKIDFGDKDWRRHNLVFNIAIGQAF